tara:strand:- start:367 stop:618 length:252 start_codon:yes stop_codon:yes gene_type:complete
MRTSPLKAYAKRPGNSQGLSPSALKAKRIRDKEAAMTPLRKKRKRENQANGQSSNYDWHHKPDGSVVKMKRKNNRDVWKHNER